MSASHLIRLGRINGKNGILNAMKHNKRTLQLERGASANIDPTKTPLNYCLTAESTPEDIATHAKVKMVQAGIDNPRKNGVMAVEVLFSLPIRWHNEDSKPFFKDCYEWVKASLGGELLSFDVHLDEAAPHAHAVILPLVDGKMRGSDMIGGIGNLNRLIGLFYSNVATYYGFAQNSKRRLSKSEKNKLESEVLAALKSDPVMKSVTWPITRDLIKKDPLLYAEILSLNKPKRTCKKSFVDMKRSRGHGVFIK